MLWPFVRKFFMWRTRLQIGCLLLLLFSLIHGLEDGEEQFCPVGCVCYSQSIVCRRPDSIALPSRLPHILPDPNGGALQYFAQTRTKLSALPKGSFVDLLDLEHIDLSNNEIMTMEEGAFENLPLLRELSLRHNKLTRLPDNFMEQFPNLEVLDLSLNSLSVLPLSLERLVNLKSLNLMGNPIHCSCSLIDLGLLLRRLEPTGSHVTCAEPMEVKNQKLVDLATKYASAYNGTRHLGYQADPRLYPEEAIESASRPIRPWPLPHCPVGHVGGEMAVEETTVGRGNRAPTITTAPEGISVAEGERAFFRCEADGWPLPVISWILPTNRTSFVRLWNRRRILELQEVHAYHEGTLTCVAENVHGQVRHSASLQILDALKPQITDAPAAQAKGGVVGSDLVLVCSARGRPRPSVSWLWMRTTSAQRLSTENRYIVRSASKLQARPLHEGIPEAEGPYSEVFADGPEESTTLIIRNVTTRDVEGRYICYAANRAGSARVSSVVTLQTPLTAAMPDKRQEMTMVGKEMDKQSGDGEGESPEGGALSLRESTEDLVKRVIEKARKRIDAAIQRTADNLRDPANRRTASDIASLFRQPSKAAIELARAAEVYEAALDEVTQILQKQREEGLGKDEGHIYRADEDYDEQKRLAMGVQLTAEQLAILAQLSGCVQSQHVNPCEKQLCFHLRYRSIDGSCNNLKNPRWGTALTPFYRLLPPVYENGVNTPVGWSPERLYFGFPKPSARLVSYTLLGDATKLQVHTRKLQSLNEQIKLAGMYNISAKRPMVAGIPPGFTLEEELFDEDDETSAMLMQWGQFLDHDLDFTPVDASTSRFSDGLGCNETCINDPPCFPIITPPGDPRIRLRCIGFARSSATCGSGSTSILLGRPQHREQINQISAFVDASNVYGSEDFESRQLRDTLYDEGRLREGMPTPSGKRLLPFNIRGQVDCQADPQQDFVPCFKAGDHRSNENLGLLSMHTIWVREHNRIADGLRTLNPHWSGDRIYQEARKIVGACMQSLTYRVWLPKILGEEGMRMLGREYTGYNASVNPTISNEFATAAFRFGHTLVSPILFRLNERWEPIPEGHLLLHQAFFAPDRMLKDGGLDPILRGLIYHGVRDVFRQPALNPELTERLFAMAHQLALDLASLNVQRGRDHGLQHYTAYAYRVCGLGSSAAPDSFDDLADRIRDPQVREKLRAVYGHPGNIDLFVGGVLEDVMPGARMGPTFACIIADQFKRLRSGDRLWYETPGLFTSAQLAELHDSGSSLARVVCENGDNITEVPLDAFKRPRSRQDLVRCEDVPKLNLALWKECPTPSGSYFGAFNDIGEFEEPQVTRRIRRSIDPTSCEGSPDVDANALEQEVEERVRLHDRQLRRRRREAGI
uniref:Ig-like domain-containing protein n=1 Tax=Schistocephalus solidus TaxID=70667 RepID=A0A0X3Q4L9_SCHSO